MDKPNTSAQLVRTGEGWEIRYSGTEVLIVPDALAQLWARRILGLAPANVALPAAVAGAPVRRIV